MTERPESRARQLPLFEAQEEMKLRTWVELARTFYLIQRRVVAALSEHDMTLPQFDVMATLRFNEGVMQQELAQRLLVTKGNVCGVVDRLERSAWVERRADPNDGRANRLYLTTVGRRKIESVLPHHDALVLKAMETLTDSDTKALRSLLEALERTNGTT